MFLSCKRLTLEESKTFFDLHRTELDSIVKLVFDQNSIQRIIIRKNNFFVLPDISCTGKNLIKYSLMCDDGKRFDFSISSDESFQENMFWDEKIKIIFDDENNKLTFAEFIRLNSINQKYLEKILHYMKQFKLSMISKSEENVFVKINISNFEGLIYFIKGAQIHGKIDSTTELEKVSDNWYYFVEHD